jgi:hypothetical protein
MISLIKIKYVFSCLTLNVNHSFYPAGECPESYIFWFSFRLLHADGKLLAFGVVLTFYCVRNLEEGDRREESQE